MERRYAPLRPEPYPAKYQPEMVGLIDAPVVKKSRVNVSTACNACRKKKTRCDGKRPVCTKCMDTTTQCAYRDESDLSDESKKLVVELTRLLNGMPPSEAIRTLRLVRTETNAAIILSTLRTEAVARGDNMADDYANISLSDTLEQLSTTETTERATNSSRASVSPPCFDHLLSWKFCYPTVPDDASAKTPVFPTTVSLPVLPIDAYTSESHVDTWTRTGWTKAHIRHLFDVLHTWDSLPFCIVSKDVFIRDYINGSDQFCSTALVDALLALATRIVNENKDDITVVPAGWFGSRYFFEEAETIFQSGQPPNSLPNVQALGVLSLYQLRCGRESEAHRLANAFATKITGLCRHEPLVGKEEQFPRIRAATYCSAISLTRMLCLATGQLFDADNHISSDVSLYQDDVSPHREENTPGNDKFEPDLNPNAHAALWRLDSIPQKLFQLTELVHKLIRSAQLDMQTAVSDLLPAYRKCLDWYEGLFFHLGTDRTRTPSMLFIHMYYHFCMLCAFRPFLSQNLGDSAIEPRRLCTQATRSILTLAQSYDDLFSLRRVSGLIPYFVCASGLFSLSVEDGNSQTTHIDSRLGDDTPQVPKTRPGQLESTGAPYAASGVYPHTDMSAAVHARLLLARMGSTHPVAMEAAKALEEMIRMPKIDMA